MLKFYFLVQMKYLENILNSYTMLEFTVPKLPKSVSVMRLDMQIYHDFYASFYFNLLTPFHYHGSCTLQ